MEVYIRRYFWLVGVVVVVVCAVFAAKGVNQYIEAKYLADRADSKPVARLAPTATASTEKARSKSGRPLATRNMFCSECEVEQATTTSGPIVDSDAPPLTSEPLNLIATNVSTVESSSFATIVNTATEEQGGYRQGQPIPGFEEIVRIRGAYVDFKNPKTKRVERISITTKTPARKTTKPVATRPLSDRDKRKSARQELMAAIDEGVKKTGDNSWEIDRGLVDKVLANPTAVGRGARIVPSIKNGKPNGFKLYAIRPSSVYAKIGLMNGDTIHAVNGFDLTTPDKALEVYTKVRESNNLTVNATRRGKPVTLTYSIK